MPGWDPECSVILCVGYFESCCLLPLSHVLSVRFYCPCFMGPETQKSRTLSSDSGLSDSASDRRDYKRGDRAVVSPPVTEVSRGRLRIEQHRHSDQSVPLMLTLQPE